MKNILGIDYGKSRVGLAIADTETRIAFGYGTMKNDNDLQQKLAKIIEKENISKIIVGKTSNSIKNKIPRFGNIEIEYQEEMFSTKMAERNLKEKGMKKIKKYDDREAARIILQSWLDKRK